MLSIKLLLSTLVNRSWAQFDVFRVWLVVVLSTNMLSRKTNQPLNRWYYQQYVSIQFEVLLKLVHGIVEMKPLNLTENRPTASKEAKHKNDQRFSSHPTKKKNNSLLLDLQEKELNQIHLLMLIVDQDYRFQCQTSDY